MKPYSSIAAGLTLFILPLYSSAQTTAVSNESAKFEQEVRLALRRDSIIEAKRALQSRSTSAIEAKLQPLCASKPGTAGFLREMAQRWLLLSEESAREGGPDVKALAVERSLALCEQALKLTENRVEQSHILLQMGLVYERQAGDNERALGFYTRAAELNTNSTVIKERIELLNKRKALLAVQK